MLLSEGRLLPTIEELFLKKKVVKKLKSFKLRRTKNFVFKFDDRDFGNSKNKNEALQ